MLALETPCTSIVPFAAVETTPTTALSSENLRFTIRSDRLAVALLVPLARSISNQKSCRRLDAVRYVAPDVIRLKMG